MIKLPDFSKCVEVKHLLISMGVKAIEPLPLVKFTRKVEKRILVKELNSSQLNYANKLHISSIPLGEGEDFSSSPNGIIEINGIKACIYIKNQRENYSFETSSSYRYHLCWCKTIDEMVEKGRKSRYVATTRDDGYFPVNRQFANGGHKEIIIKLELCKNCQQILEENNMYFIPFELRKFYAYYQTNIADSFMREEICISEEQYAPNQTELAARYKEASNYTCGICNVVCASDKSLLHLHHKDGDGQNNKHNNLIVLCLDCHAREFKHSHMKNNPEFKKNIEKIYALRKQQRITYLGI